LFFLFFFFQFFSRYILLFLVITSLLTTINITSYSDALHSRFIILKKKIKLKNK
jgi:hypothetical protein